MNWLGALLGTLPEAIASYFTERMRTKSAEKIRAEELRDALHQRQVDLISQGLHADMQWETEMARQAATSWKDEYTLLVVSMPAIMAFIPGLDQYVHAGFAALAQTPGWYQLLLVTLFLATVGIRYWRRSQSDT